ncbi:MAG: beta-hydroxyacyl-ACP dehydratase [Phycisphaerae bacterium]|nr:beta-hydroxyacyl-ACP dehydratase [Phycisphaerae bacterium]
MPALPFIDLNTLDLETLQFTREQVYAHLPHRFEFMQLDGVIHIDRDAQVAVGLREVREDEFWVRGHIPGRPLFPGVLMLETAAQMASFLSQELQPESRFLGFGGLDNVKFRGAVIPPARMYVIEKVVELRSRRTVCDAQGFVDGRMVFEARITGMPL